MKHSTIKLTAIAALSASVAGLTNMDNNSVYAESNSVERINGETRYDTAAKISQAGFESADTVVIANAMNFADALSGVPLAYQNDAPILLANGDSLRASTTKEIYRLSAKKAIILGGEFAVSKEVEAELKAMGLSTDRLAGDTRFETAELIADELITYTNSDKAVVVDGYNFADAMSVAPFAAQEGMPIYLTRPAELPEKEALDAFNETLIIGGVNAVSKNVENELNNPQRLAGINRFETNLKVLDYFDVESNELYVATGMNFADALTGSVVAAKHLTGVALVREQDQDLLESYLDTKTFTNYSILGGEIAVPLTISSNLEMYLNESRIITEIFERENEVNFESETIENDELPIGEERFVQNGEYGYDEVVYEITKVNGTEISRTELSRKTIDPVKEIFEIGTKFIPVESVQVSNFPKSLFTGETYELEAKLVPDNTTNKEIFWKSSDIEVARITNEGKIEALSEGTVEITAYADGENYEETFTLTIVDPDIVEMDVIKNEITQFDSYALPQSLVVELTNNTEKEVQVDWKVESVDTSEAGIFTFSGHIPEFDREVTLELTVAEFSPNIVTNAYSNFTINNVSQAASIQIRNHEDTEVGINKIELYENGRLFTTYTPQRLTDSNIPTTVLPGGNWGISLNFGFGFSLNNSYVKYYFDVHGEEYVFEEIFE